MLLFSMPKQPKKQPMGRPPSPDGAMKQIGLRLPADLLADYETMGKEERRKRADMIRVVLEERRDAWKRSKKS